MEQISKNVRYYQTICKQSSYLGVQDLRGREEGRWSKELQQSGRSRKICTIEAKMHPNP